MKLLINKANFLPHQYEFIRCPAKIKALVTGFGGGKTYAFLRETLKHHLTNRRDDDGKSNGWVIYPTLELARDLFIDDFKALLEDKGINYKFSSQTLTFKSVYGKIKIYTLERPERMVGSNLTFIGIDEFDTTKYKKSMEAYKKILGRMRGNDHTCLFIVTTPEGFKATYKIFVENDTKDKMIFHAKTTDNPYLPKDYIETLRQEYDEKMLQAYLNGQFVNLNSGQVYYGFDRDKHLSEFEMKIEPTLPLNLFFDFNIFPMSAGLAQHKNKEDIRILQEWVLKGHSTTWDICRAIKQSIPYERAKSLDAVVYGDAAGKVLGTKSNMSDYQIIWDEFDGYFGSLTHKVPTRNPAVKDRVNCFNARLSKGAIKINKSCVKMTRDLEQVTWNEKGNEIDKSNIELTHISDGGGYYINTAFPIIRYKNNIETKSF